MPNSPGYPKTPKKKPADAAYIAKRNTPSGRRVVAVNSPGQSRVIGVENKKTGKFSGTAGQDWRAKSARKGTGPR